MLFTWHLWWFAAVKLAISMGRYATGNRIYLRHKPKIRNIIRMLIESRFYFDLSLRERHDFVHFFLLYRTVGNCLPVKKGGLMNGTRTDYTGPRNGRVNRNEWESILRRLDALADEINRALGRSTRIEDPRNGIRIARPPKDD
jgi:hypothetical protein